jgi:hypothetical protein
MIESLEQALLAAWSGLAFIPVIGHALEAAFSSVDREQSPGDDTSFVAGPQYELESLP